MARKYELITELYEQTLREVSARQTNWTAFLRSACRNYRLPFEELLLIYAQRPDATAVLPIEGANGWNTRFGRWVNRGATGIAVFDREYTQGTRLKYYFDISDTHASRFARPVPLWEMRPGYEQDVIEVLENSFGELESKESLAAALISAAKNIVEDNITDYLDDLLISKEGSFLEELDDFNVEVAYRDALETSVAYMLLTRCGIKADEYFTREDFRNLLDFNTPETVNALGTATSDIAEMGLVEIARAVRSCEKEQFYNRARNAKIRENAERELPAGATRQNRTFAENPKVRYAENTEKTNQPERSFENGTDLYHAGRLSPAEPDRAGGTGSELWKIRPASPVVSERPPQNPVHQSVDIGQADSTPAGNRGSGAEPVGADRGGNGEGRKRDGGTESPRSDGMGTEDEQLPGFGGGSDPQGTDNQLTLLPGVEEQQNTIEAEAAVKTAEKASAFVISQEDIDAVLQSGSGVEEGKYRIYEQFQRSLSQSENAKFLKEEYGWGGRYPAVHGTNLDEGHNEKGITISRGSISNPDVSITLSWTKAAKRIAELIKLDRYLNSKEKERYPAYLERAEERRQQAAEAAAAREVLSRAPQEEQPAKKENARYEYHLGDTAYLGAEEYEILAFDENEVRLFDVGFPLINKVLPRTEFDAKVRANPMNDHLIAPGEPGQQDVSVVKDTHVDDMLRYAEEIAAVSALPPEERFFLIETEAGYAIWDDATEDIYVDDEGVSEEFTSEWQAQAYLEEVKQAVSKKESAEWLAVERAKLPSLEYAVGDQFTIFSEDGTSNSEFVLTGIAEHDVWYTFPDLPEQPPVSMRREEFENNLRNGHIREQQPEAAHKEIFTTITQYNKMVRVSEDEFDRLKGNLDEDGIPYAIYRANGIVEISFNPEQEAAVMKVVRQLDNDLIGKEISIDGHRFVVDRISSVSDDVTLRDVTFEGNMGFPINRMEKIDTVRRLIRQQEQEEKSAPTYASDDRFEEQYLLGEGDILTIDGRQYALAFFGDETSTIRTLDEPYDTIQFTTDEFLQLLRQYPENDRYLQNPDDLGVFGSPFPPEDDIPAKKEEALAPPPPPARREKASPFVLHPEIPTSERHNFQITDDHLGEGGAKTKFKNNVAAIRTLQEIEFSGRLATPEEQEILSRYVGWGGLPQAFDENNEQWSDEFTELYTLLSPEEYEAAKATTLNAHYTSPTVIKAIYQAVENMGFRTGNILEPSCGIGNFFGLVPESMKDSKLFGVELDSITGRIAQQLYQKNSIAVQGFEETELPDSFFDLAIGNVPFGSYSLHDKRYDKHHFLIHDYFFARTLDKVRPGGIVAFVTSKGTMDKQNPNIRKYIAERAELLGAIRLPNTAFYANAGTEVTTDIIFLQKREKLIDVSVPDENADLDWLHLGQTENGVPINQYFLNHPEMVLGEMAFDDMMYGGAKETTCIPFENENLADLLAEAVQNIHAEYTDYEIEGLEDEEEDKSIPADPAVRNFSFTVVDGAIYYRENSRMFPVEQSLTGQSRVKGMIAIRDSVRRLIEYQTENAPDDIVEREQRELGRLYDGFTAKYGLINSRANKTAFSPDNSFPLLSSLEVLDENGNLERKADMFHKRTINPYMAVSKVDTASEALAVSIGEKACVDLGFMASLMGDRNPAGRSEKIEQIKRDLAGVIFKDPDSGNDPFAGWQTADEYLSGRVRDKLKRAREAAEKDPAYARNVEALEQVQPKDLTAGEINVRLGTTWMPPDVIEDFTFELLKTPRNCRHRIHIRYSKVTGEWNVSEKSLDRSNIRAYNTYGTQRINAYKIIEDTLNLRDVRIFDTQYDAEGRERRILNKKETAIAQDKQDLIKQKFQEWIWAEPSRRDRLCRIYNDKFNSIRPREYDGSHLILAGMNPEKKLRPHQRNAVARAIYGGNALFGHVVGAGKSATRS